MILTFIVSIVASWSCYAGDEGNLERTVDCSFTADHDGSEQKYVLIMPENFAKDQPADALIALHGHGSDRWQFVRDTRDECRGAREVAEANKMIFVSPDYRAKTSWMGPAAEADLVQLVGILKQKFKLKRVILCGGSMGGTGALTFTAKHPNLIDGVVSLNGTANLLTYERFQDAIAESFGGSKQQIPEQYRQRSAELFPEQFTMPIAATTGGKDDVVPPDSVLRLLKNIRSHNSKVLSLHRPEGGHSTNYEDSKAAIDFVVSKIR